MIGKRKLTVLTCAVSLLVASMACGGGFNIYEAGAKATALGGAFTATADDGSALFYNPAGLAWLEGSALDFNLMPILPSAEFTGATLDGTTYASGKTASQTFPIPGLYGYHKYGDVTYGLGVYAPFGLGVEWEDPETWVGRYTSYDVDLATIYMTPAMAWKASDKVSMSFGFDVAFTTLELNKITAYPLGRDGDLVDILDAKIDATSKVDITPNFGVMFKPTCKLSLGAMYHQGKSMKFHRQTMTLTNIAPANLQQTTDGVIAGLGGAEQEANASIDLPHILSIGVAYQLTEAARLEVNGVHMGWRNFEEIFLNFENDALDQVIEEDYNSIWQLRVGLDYAVMDGLNAMAGYVYDTTPQPVESMNPMLPDATRNDFSFGLAYQVSDKLSLTGTWMTVNFEERSNVVDGVQQSFEPGVNPAGTYDSFANIFGVGVGYKF
jgi:long-chain fatty acid transport protein